MSWQYLSSKKGVAARKEHKCTMCGESILVGEKYDTRNGVDDGDFVTMRMHPECNEASIAWDEADWATFEPGGMVRGKDAPRDEWGGME